MSSSEVSSANKIDDDNVKGSYWFYRQEDEPFIGDLTDKNQDQALLASKNYADFIAASTNMSMKSFRSYQGFSEVSAGTLYGAKFASDKFQQETPPLSWKQWLNKYKVVIALVAYFIAAIFFVVFYVAPAFYIADNTGLCQVTEAEVHTVRCKSTPETSLDFCVQENIVLNVPGNQLRVLAFLKGYPELSSLDTKERVSCAYLTCDSAHLAEGSSEDEARDAAELKANQTIGSLIKCIYVTQDMDPLARRFYEKELSSGESEVSIIKGPDKEIASIGVAAVFSAFAVMLVVAVVVSMRKRIIQLLRRERGKSTSSDVNMGVQRNVKDKDLKNVTNPWAESSKIRAKLNIN